MNSFAITCRMCACDPASTPATTSLWPFRYLVALWATRSMPCSIGRWKSGLLKLLSQRVSTPCSFAIAATAERSCSSKVSELGLSRMKRRVFPRQARR